MVIITDDHDYGIECAEGSSLCKMELSVYIGGVMQDKRIVTHRYRLDEMSSPISQIHVGSDVYGVSAFIGDIAALAVSVLIHDHL